ncbi:iron uptake transporter deferrochelatase/peroxidase subunit [Rhodoferax sp.]|uniref:iron uptake transporter deferrochelatase/peroxidase subunit n=1 Tax=Rhodoferax sp. TaxID=50421 RepID=UPI0025EB1EC5|nr:iron uptake transporter deferrochelatase/peroxidase subunit [Rhodoferax sp.]
MKPVNPPAEVSRRGFFGTAGGLAVAAGALGPAQAAKLPAAHSGSVASVPFHGPHQSGILTPAQRHTYFAVFALDSDKRADVIALLRQWTEVSARLARGEPAYPGSYTPDGSADPLPGDSGETMGLPPENLTLTFGFGPGLFSKNGVDRYGLAGQRPAALVDLPKFNGDQLITEKTGGDLSVQACADDPQVAFHAIRQLARAAYGKASLQWTQTGFTGDSRKETPRNLMGFKDGSNNPATNQAALMRNVVWVGNEGPAWMRDGSYMVVRRVRIALEHWDRMPLDFQEQVVGRKKSSGAPLGKLHEHDAADLEAVDPDGELVVPEAAHIRLSAAANNGGTQMLRRGYSYHDGSNFHSERWPPWKQAVEFDAGLLFFCYQKDPRTSFIPTNHRLAGLDTMNQFTTHNGSGIFACPPGVQAGSYLGAALFEAAAASA